MNPRLSNAKNCLIYKPRSLYYLYPCPGPTRYLPLFRVDTEEEKRGGGKMNMNGPNHQPLF